MSKDWLSAVQDAIHENDPQVAEAKIRMAEGAIFNRIHDFSATDRPESPQPPILLKNKRCSML
jgi:hypothetical protein